MNTTSKPVNDRTASAHGDSESRAGDLPRTTRVAALFNTAASLGAIVLIAAASGPKLPKVLGD